MFRKKQILYISVPYSSDIEKPYVKLFYSAVLKSLSFHTFFEHLCFVLHIYLLIMTKS